MRLLLTVLCCLICKPSFAAQIFTCTDAYVSIEIVKSNENENSVVSVVTVSRKEASTVLRYVNIDYIGGSCVKDSTGSDKVLFQAHCGGSGCNDLDNWGIIDPSNLQVLLEPNNTNRLKAIENLQQFFIAVPDKKSARLSLVGGGLSPSTLAQASSSNWAFGGIAGNRQRTHTDNPTIHNATATARILSNILSILPWLQGPLSPHFKGKKGA